MLWLYFAVAAAFVAGFIDVIAKKITNENNQAINSALITFIFTGLFSLILIIYRIKHNYVDLNKIDRKNYIHFIIYALLFLLIEIFYWQSIKYGKNPGMSRLVYNTNIIFTFTVAYLFFNATINFNTIVGIFITMLGLSIVVTSSKL